MAKCGQAKEGPLPQLKSMVGGAGGEGAGEGHAHKEQGGMRRTGEGWMDIQSCSKHAG